MHNKRMGCVIEAGSIVQCPGCQTDIAILVKPYYTNTVITLDLFEWLAFDFDYGSETKCDKCETYWSSPGYLYIKGHGWMPKHSHFSENS